MAREIIDEPIESLDQPWENYKGSRVREFIQGKLAEHETGIEGLSEGLQTIANEAIADVEQGEVNQENHTMPIKFYKVTDPEHENPQTINIPVPQEAGVVTYPKVTVTLDTESTVKLGDEIRVRWRYEYIISENGSQSTQDTPAQTVTIRATQGSQLLYQDIKSNVANEHEEVLTLGSDIVTSAGNVRVEVVAVVDNDGEEQTARASRTTTVVTMNLSTSFSPATQLAISNGITDGQTISIPYNFTVPNGTTLRIFIDGGEPITSTISGTGRNFVTLQASELADGRHNVQMIAENNGLLSDAVIVDFLKAGGTDDYLGLRLSLGIDDIEEMPLAYDYGESELPLTVEQFGSVNIDFAAWQSESQMADVRVYVDGGETPTQVLSVDRSLQTLSQRFDTSGSHTMAIAVGTAVMGFSVSVQAASGVTETEAAGYLVKLSANGRSNNEATPDDWGGITAFNGVNFNTNGWITDSDGVTSLLLTNGATAEIDIKPFIIDGDYSIELAGFALGMKVKVSQVMERGATVVRCLYDNGGEGYPMGIQVTTEKAAMLFGGVEEVKTADKMTDGDGNYINFEEVTVTAGTDISGMGYYVKAGLMAYVPTTDTVAISGKTYYEAVITDDEHAADLYIIRPKGVEMNIAIDEWMDLYFVALPSSGGYGLGMLFINGVLSRANRYSGALIQSVAQSIVFDSDKADVRVRGLYYYRFPLIADEVLDNVIINQHSAAEIQAMHEKNAVGDANNTTDADGNIIINRDALLGRGRGVLTIIRSNDSGMGLTDMFSCVDKKQNFKADLVKWEPPLDSQGNPIGQGFEARNIRMRIQGTSSVKYPYKNLRIYLTTAQDGTRSLVIGGVDVTQTASGYPLRGSANSIAQSVLCAKTDFVDSSLAGNTGGAHLFDYTMRALGLLTPPQEYDARVRQSVDGLPCDIYAGTSETGTLTYCGQFVLNNEKSKSGKIFGMEGVSGFSGTEANPYSIALEALDNNSPMTLFHPAGSANSEALENQLSEYFDNGFEFNHPEDAVWATIGTGDYAAWNGAKDDFKRWLGWIYDCVANTDGVLGGTMTIENPDYGTSAGWSGKSKWVCQKFKDELSQYFDKNHLLTYYLIIDYLAGKDQLAKNIIWRCWNRLIWYSTFYDGDTWEAIRNDAFIVYLYNITRDSYDTERSKYAFEGHSSWLWCLVLANFEDDIRTCAANLRNQLTTQAMLDEFVGTMIGNWSERQYNKSGKLKYIDTIDTMNYVYTLTGNREAHIKAFLKDRSRLLDARYAVGQYNGDVITFTVVRNASDPQSSLTLRSGDLYFFGYKLNGLWLQGPTQVNADETLDLIFSQTLATNDPLMLGGASCIKEIDFTNMGSQLNGTVNLSLCTMLTKLVMPATNGVANAPLTLGDITKLQYIDISGQTSIHTGTAGVFDVSKQSRLGTLLAGGTLLSTVNLPEGAPVSVLTLPSTLTLLKLRYLPELTSTGLTLQGTANITGFNFAACPHLDWQTLLNRCPNVQNIRVEGIKGKIDPDWLEHLATMGGYDANGNTIANPALVGSVTLTKVVTDERLAALRQTFIYLQITECQYSVYEFNDLEPDPACVTNLENGTSGYDEYDENTGDLIQAGYTASGHALKVRQKMRPVFGRMMTVNGQKVWQGAPMSESNYANMADGTTVDNTGLADAMMLLPHCWYKGINDYKNQKKYICWSALDDEPQSSATHIYRKTLSNEILYRAGGNISLENITEGVSTLDSEGVIAGSTGYNIYKINIEGMKQVRWPGRNSSVYGVAFLDANGVIIEKWGMSVSGDDFDFMETEGDYIFRGDFPVGAVEFVFSSMVENHGVNEVIAVDTDEVEAIEPDWVEHKECLVGIYQASVDTDGNLRSLSGKTVKRGTGTSTTWAGWEYNNLGNPTNTPTGTLNFTMKDFQNVSRLRGLAGNMNGYQLIDYEMSKFVAILFYCLHGNLNAQAVCGVGAFATTTGYTNGIGNANSYSGQYSGNKCLGIESFFACVYEWVDNIGINVASYITFYRNRMSGGTANRRWVIYDPVTNTERSVLEKGGDGYIKRVRNGRFCDIVPTATGGTGAGSNYRYADYNYYSSSSGRVLGRSSGNGGVFGGLAYADANSASSHSHTSVGSRLAFRGNIEIQESESNRQSDEA